MNDPTTTRRPDLAARRASLSDAKQALLARRLGALATRAPATTIPRAAERTGRHPASFAQQRLWFVDQLVPGSASYNLGAAVELRGRLDRDALVRSLRELVRRHDVLRTCFGERDGVVEQVVAPIEQALEVTIVDLTGCAPGERAGACERLARADLERGFDLATGPLLRASLVILDDTSHQLLLMMHHIVSDGWSVGVMVKEIAALYDAFARGAPSPLPELTVQYADVARWQHAQLAGDGVAPQLAYWARHLDGAPGVLELPQARPRPAQPTFAGTSLTVRWDADLVTPLRALGQRQGATLFMTLLAAFQVLLHRYTGQTDSVIGTPVANRSRPELEDLIGFFVNTLPLRADLAGEPSFLDLLARTKEACLGGFAHQDLPFERLVEHLQPERDARYHPVYQVMFVLQNAPAPAIDLAGVQLVPLQIPSASAKLDLTLSVEEDGDALAATLEYSTERFDDLVARRLLEHLEILLRAVVAAPATAVAQLPLLSAAERTLVLDTWSAAPEPLRADPTLVHHRVAARAALHPDATAVVHGDTRVTYADLERRANRLAHHLRARGVGPEVRVALALDRSVDMVVAVLAVWKAGGAYVPVDPSYPAARIDLMLALAKAPVLVTQAALLQPAWAVPAGVVCLDRDAAAIATAPDHDPAVAVTGEHLSHVIFTSGSTGTPKGVAIRHRSVAARLDWARHRFSDLELSGVLFATSLSFDLSVFELWAPLSTGGTVLVAGSILDFPDLPHRHLVRLVNTVPSAMAEIVAVCDLDGVVTVNLAGEALPRDLVTALYRKPSVARVYNLYGPSEDTTYSTEELVPRDDTARPAIGRPLPGTRVYLLDPQRNPVPAGVAGELFVAGVGLARAYLDRPDLTADRFVPSPFDADADAVMYRTGDLARFLPDGRLDYLGRLDHQVKLRGFRIELGDIEAALRDLGMRDAVVLARDLRGASALVAYVVPPAPAPSDRDLLADLARRLPAYMVPAAVVFLDAFPLSPNGKLDRKALPAPAAGEAATRPRVAPRDRLEHALVEIWESLLAVRPIGVTDDFFELGGHSLRVLGLAAAIERRVGRKLPVAALYRARTVRDLADLLRREQVIVDQPTVVLRAPEGGRTLFAVHPASGNALVYEPLARHLGPHGLVGLHARGLAHDEQRGSTVRELAADYLSAIRTLQPDGPYALAGYSLGGVIAHEMAVQLEACGQAVDVLVLLDSWAPGAVAPGTEPTGDVELLLELARDHGLALDEAELRALDRDACLARVLGELRRHDLLPAEAGRDELERGLRTYQANVAAVERHAPGGFTGRIDLALAADTAAADPDAAAAALGWAAVSATAPAIHPIAGSHRSLVSAPDVAAVASIILDALTTPKRKP